jgi:hypothetical protein
LEPDWNRRRLRAPREEGAVLAIPPLAEMLATITRNREQIAQWNVTVLGRPLADLRRLAREEALTAATRFVGRVFNLSVNSWQIENLPHVPLIASGHQPELFHPGVWAKNFLLDDLAKSTGGIGLHLIVDNDAITSTSIAVPVGLREQPRIEQISFDSDATSVPWEEAPLQDESLFCSFPDRVAAALSCWPIEPILPTIWPAAIARLTNTAEQPRPRLFELLSTVRHEAERRAGLNSLELPISQLCETETFAWFACSLLSDPQRTHTVYNQVVAEYRRINRVRNRQRPVPDLRIRANGDWLEFPFWVWQAGDSQRGRLFVRATKNEIQLANGETVIASLPQPLFNMAESAVAQLRALSSRGWKLRPRALTTTLFARVFLADAFLHGIGGAKYDEMTDRLIARLFGVAPPSYLTVTATHRLPIGGWNVTPSDIAALKHRLWDFEHNPERHFSTNWRQEGVGIEATALLTEKQRLIAEQQTQDSLDFHDPQRASRVENDQRRRRFQEINRQLASRASETRSALTTDLQDAQRQLAANSILRHREYAFCLFPDLELAPTVCASRIRVRSIPSKTPLHTDAKGTNG